MEQTLKAIHDYPTEFVVLMLAIYWIAEKIFNREKSK